MSVTHTDSVTHLLDQLCCIPSHVDLNTVPPQTEEAISRAIYDMLTAHPWLSVRLDEVAPHRFNVLASDGPLEDTTLLITGHIDTVTMSDGWTICPGSISNDRYYHLGAGDAKGGISAMLDAIPKVGPTKGVSYLLYCDEEYHFAGFTHFLEQHTEIKPRLALSLCGPSESLLTGCRGLIELELEIQGVSAHASRPHLGCNAIQALTSVVEGLRRFCGTEAFNLPGSPTAFNLAAIHGGGASEGTRSAAIINGPPEVLMPANKVPDRAWALIDIRPGSAALTTSAIEREIARHLDAYNAYRESSLQATIHRLSFTHSYGAYTSDHAELEEIVESFATVHDGRFIQSTDFGYIDVAELANRRGTPLACIAPKKGRDHAPDEFVDIASLITYRNACIKLLSRFK